MLKIRNLIFALSVSPLLSLAWQLPNQAQTLNFNRSSCTAGCNSGANTGAAQTTIFSVPSRTGGRTGARTTTATTPTGNIINIPVIFGISPSIATGISTIGDLIAGSTKVTISTATTELNSSSITVTDGAAQNIVVITLSPQVQITVNQLAAAIVRNIISTTPGNDIPPIIVLMNGGAGAENAAVFVTNSLTTAGISLQQAQQIVQALNGLLASPIASSLNLPQAQTTLGQLRASSKVIKPVSVIAKAEEVPNVNVNKLNDAIIAYDGIILQSKPEPLKKLYRDQDFVAIGKILQELRRAIP